ncbi:hypothetical protein BJX66DRAFT_304051 [Aspergillus keveii]|uniref:Uncharacterized protein n=1 Tax=Aspergillus keveii TaxID=714993 RepID=A0ABR4G5L1_9EURO
MPNLVLLWGWSCPSSATARKDPGPEGFRFAWPQGSLPAFRISTHDRPGQVRAAEHGTPGESVMTLQFGPLPMVQFLGAGRVVDHDAET